MARLNDRQTAGYDLKMKTPAQEAGFVVGQRYTLKDTTTFNATYVKPGDIVEFIKDDDTKYPWFKNLTPTGNAKNFNEIAIPLEALVLPDSVLLDMI